MVPSIEKVNLSGGGQFERAAEISLGGVALVIFLDFLCVLSNITCLVFPPCSKDIILD